MMTKKYLEFERYEWKKGFAGYEVIEHSVTIGRIECSAVNKKHFSFYVDDSYCFNVKTLREIANFLNKLNKKHKEE